MAFRRRRFRLRRKQWKRTRARRYKRTRFYRRANRDKRWVRRHFYRGTRKSTGSQNYWTTTFRRYQLPGRVFHKLYMTQRFNIVPTTGPTGAYVSVALNDIRDPLFTGTYGTSATGWNQFYPLWAWYRVWACKVTVRWAYIGDEPQAYNPQLPFGPEIISDFPYCYTRPSTVGLLPTTSTNRAYTWDTAKRSYGRQVGLSNVSSGTKSLFAAFRGQHSHFARSRDVYRLSTMEYASDPNYFGYYGNGGSTSFSPTTLFQMLIAFRDFGTDIGLNTSGTFQGRLFITYFVESYDPVTYS